MHKNEDSLKKEEEDDLKNEDNHINEDDLRNKDELINEDDPQNGNVSDCCVIVYYKKKMLMTPDLESQHKCYQLSKLGIEFDVMEKMCSAFHMRTCTEKTTFEAKTTKL